MQFSMYAVILAHFTNVKKKFREKLSLFDALNKKMAENQVVDFDEMTFDQKKKLTIEALLKA